ncbi:regulator of protease activity HflC (stomatin/prohibitin superfamily) [Nocardioides cavernae]|uniref:Regulator of protease activity HflC (Stomatin/prohibitin superfamily) n=1 Tax=Nocardioides cavernae TaxID=1921566 RepID=A0A7Y9KUS0_9ACTN|nr:SPFH domain-containing protein [Nocardioides cavernae]NYE38967.1 regulator of protease activity HflC (stomatin/prohibitin superfamily) [Nocardioides cavernae]
MTRKHLIHPTRTVQPWEALLERRDGEPTVVLGPGRHVVRRRATYELVDLRERIDLVPAQEVPTSDGVSAKVSAVFRWAVVDPVAFTERLRDPVGAVYLAVQLGLRDALATREAEALVRETRTRLAEGVRERATAAADEVGVRLVDVVVKDVVLPHDLREAYAELVVGRHRAQAQLEAARAETAALRSLANGAKLLDDHPSLAQLRLVQALPPGSRVELVQPGRTSSHED